MSSCDLSSASRALSNAASTALDIQNTGTNPGHGFLVRMAAVCQGGVDGVTATQRTISNILSQAESGESAINDIVTHAGGDAVMALQSYFDDRNTQLQSIVKQGISNLEQASGYDELVKEAGNLTSMVSAGSDFVDCLTKDIVNDADRFTDLLTNLNKDAHTAVANIKKYTNAESWVKKIKSSIKDALTSDVKGVIDDVRNAVKPFADDITSVESSVTQVKNALKNVRSLSTDFSSLLSSATSIKGPTISSKDTLNLLKKAGMLDAVKQNLPMPTAEKTPPKYRDCNKYTAVSVSHVAGKDKAQDYQKMLTQQAAKIKKIVEAV